MNYKKMVCLLLWAYVGYASAQNITKTDTVELARKLGYAKEYPQAVSLLEQFERSHPNDVNAIRLHGQVLYWMQNFDGAFQLFEASQKRSPNKYVQLDYGRMLFELYHLAQAQDVLEDYLKTDPENVEALDMLGTLAYWRGHTAMAKTYFNKVFKQYPQNDWAVKYTKEIAEAATPYLNITGGYSSDSQPLQVASLNVGTGWYQSYLLAPQFDVKAQNFATGGTSKQSETFLATNKFYFAGLNLKVNVGAGVYRSPVDGSAGWLGNIQLDEKISNEFSVDVFAAHKPYFNTIASLSQAVTYYNYGADVVYIAKDSWSGWAGVSQQHYMDNNNLISVGASVLSPPLAATDELNFYLGYAINYSDANSDNYIPSVTVAQVLQTNTFTGVYSPYFTPRNQLENDVVVNIVYKPDDDLRLSLNSRTGVYTVADKPYFYLNYNAAKVLVIQKGFYQQKFIPLQINPAVSYAVSDKFTLLAGYTYTHTFFYNSNAGTIGLNFKF